MGRFSADWLALREPADVRARSSAVLEAIREAGGSGPRGSGFSRGAPPLSIIDLGAGTAANLRYLAPRLGGAQDWLLVDSDRALLDAARARILDWGATLGASSQADAKRISVAAGTFSCVIRTLELDMARELDALALPRDCLVTASALLDLVSARWIETLAEACCDAHAHVLFALTYDGRFTLEPPHPDDGLVRACFNRHQQTDKGFGPALGPEAPAAARAAFARRGYALETATSDWILESADRRLQAELLDGWRDAALEIEPGLRRKLETWHAHHCQRVDAGESTLVVGHSDLAGRPLR